MIDIYLRKDELLNDFDLSVSTMLTSFMLKMMVLQVNVTMRSH